MNAPDNNFLPCPESETETPPAVPPTPPDPLARFPEDLRTPWGWAELALFAVFGFAGLIVLNNLLAAAAVLWLGMKPEEVAQFTTTNAAFISVRQALWYGLLLLYLLALVRVRHRMPYWRTIGWRQFRGRWMPASAIYPICLASGMALAVGVQFASLFLRTGAKLPIEALFRERRSVLWLMAMGILLAPVVEETIFRGYVYPVLARSFGVAGGVLATGVLFGLVHAPQLWGGWGQIALLATVGIVFTYARARSGTVLTSYLLHLGYNSFLFAGFYFYTGGLRNFPSGS